MKLYDSENCLVVLCHNEIFFMKKVDCLIVKCYDSTFVLL